MDRHNRPHLTVEQWRNGLRNCRRPAVPEGEQALRDWATLALADQGVVSHISRMLGGAALFSLGELRYALDILDLYKVDNQYESARQWRCHVFMLTDLLPLPRELDPSRFADHDAIKRWVEQNQTRLRWDEAVGRYVFTDKVAEDTPTRRKEAGSFFSTIWKKLAGR